MKLRIAFFLTFSFCLISLQAQMFQEGRLFTKEGDTLDGLIAPEGKTMFVFKADKNSGRSFLELKDLSGFEKDGEMYQHHTVEVLRGNFPEKVRSFLRVVSLGPVNLLEYRGAGIFGGEEHVNYYLHYGDQVPMRVNQNPGNFKTTMRYYFADFEELAKRIKSKELGYDNLEEIVKMYNDWYVLQKSDAPIPDPEPENDSGSEE